MFERNAVTLGRQFGIDDLAVLKFDCEKCSQLAVDEQRFLQPA